MAVFCLAESLGDLKECLGNIVVAETRGREPVFARDLMGPGPMAALLKEAILPNMVQTRKRRRPSCMAGRSPTSPTVATR